MDLNERALAKVIEDITNLGDYQPDPMEFQVIYNRAIHHAANSIREILEKYRGMK